MMLWMSLWGIFWLIVLGVAVWALVRWVSGRAPVGGPSSGPWTSPSAMEILRQRYARGEIDATTFEQMRARLEATGQGESMPTAG
jgi:putative membrane protein